MTSCPTCDVCEGGEVGKRMGEEREGRRGKEREGKREKEREGEGEGRGRRGEDRRGKERTGRGGEEREGQRGMKREKVRVGGGERDTWAQTNGHSDLMTKQGRCWCLKPCTKPAIKCYQLHTPGLMCLGMQPIASWKADKGELVHCCVMYTVEGAGGRRRAQQQVCATYVCTRNVRTYVHTLQTPS